MAATACERMPTPRGPRGPSTGVTASTRQTAPTMGSAGRRLAELGGRNWRRALGSGLAVGHHPPRHARDQQADTRNQHRCGQRHRWWHNFPRLALARRSREGQEPGGRPFLFGVTVSHRLGGLSAGWQRLIARRGMFCPVAGSISGRARDDPSRKVAERAVRICERFLGRIVLDQGGFDGGCHRLDAGAGIFSGCHFQVGGGDAVNWAVYRPLGAASLAWGRRPARSGSLGNRSLGAGPGELVACQLRCRAQWLGRARPGRTTAAVGTQPRRTATEATRAARSTTLCHGAQTLGDRPGNLPRQPAAQQQPGQHSPTKAAASHQRSTNHPVRPGPTRGGLIPPARSPHQQFKGRLPRGSTVSTQICQFPGKIHRFLLNRNVTFPRGGREASNRA